MPATPGTTNLPHACIVWFAIVGQFDKFGEILVEQSPQQITCWKKSVSELTKAIGIGGSNDSKITDSIVVDRYVPYGSRLWLGTLKQWNSLPGQGPILFVNDYAETTSALSGEILTRTCTIQRYQNKLE